MNTSHPLPHVTLYLGERVKLHWPVLLCRLAQKIWDSDLRAHIHCKSEQSLLELDELLWKEPPSSFLPHAVLPDDDHFLTPITLAVKEELFPENVPVLINLATEIPQAFNRFERIVEFAGADQSGAEERSQTYQEYGCKVKVKTYES